MYGALKKKCFSKLPGYNYEYDYDILNYAVQLFMIALWSEYRKNMHTSVHYKCIRTQASTFSLRNPRA